MGLSTPALDLHHRLGAIELIDVATEQPIRLSEGWADKTVVLVHLRHFGCLFCRKQVDELVKAQPALDALGAYVVTIGTGDVAYGQRFAQTFKLAFPVLVDEAMASYRAVGCVEQSLVNWVAPGNLKMVARTMQLGFRQGKGGPNQRFMGATHVISRERVCFSWLNDDFSTDAPLRLVLEALEDLHDDRKAGSAGLR